MFTKGMREWHRTTLLPFYSEPTCGRKKRARARVAKDSHSDSGGSGGGGVWTPARKNQKKARRNAGASGGGGGSEGHRGALRRKDDREGGGGRRRQGHRRRLPLRLRGCSLGEDHPRSSPQGQESLAPTRFPSLPNLPIR